MKHVRERIRINGVPISEDIFTKRFFEVWNKIPHNPTPLLDIPRYLQLLTLTSYHVFLSEEVDVAIYEAHLGGEFDATNIVKNPIVTAITSIEMDHVRLLGPSIQDIAWHKAGIFKSGALAFSTTQLPDVAVVLDGRAKERGTVLEFIGIDPSLPNNAESLKPLVQRFNCSLALKVVRAWLECRGPRAQLTVDDVASGVQSFFWPGRFHKIIEGSFQWFLDGAHTDASVKHAVQWYASNLKQQRKWVLRT
jgi:folylpolyglutamate synthase